MIRRVFPVMLPHASDDACRVALQAGASPGALFVEAHGALPRLGEELTVSCRRAGGPELLRIDGRATWAVHEPIGRYRRGFAIALAEGATALVDAALSAADSAPPFIGNDARPPFATARPGSTLPAPVLDEDRLAQWRLRYAERGRVVVEPVQAPAPPAADEVTAPAGDDEPVPMPAITVDAFAAAARDDAHATAPERESASGQDDVVATTSDGKSAPRRNPWLSSPDGDPQELPRLVDDDEEDATLLIGPRARPLPVLPEAGEPIPFPTLAGAAWVIAADRPKQSPSSAEKLSWPRSGTKRGMSPFADNDDTIPVGLWAMPSLVHHSITSDEDTPDELSDPRLIVRAADRARALDNLSDVPDLPDVRPSGAPHSPLTPTLQKLVDDADDESTDAALDESTADASGEDPLERAPLAPSAPESAQATTASNTRGVLAVEEGAHTLPIDEGATTEKIVSSTGASIDAPSGAHGEKATTRGAILVAWGAEPPRVLFDGDVALPVHTVLDVPRRHLRFAEIAVFEGGAASEQPKALLGIVRLQVTPETNSRTLPVRFSLSDDGTLSVTYDGRIVERLATAWAPRTRAPLVETAPSSTFVGRLKRLFQGH